MSDYINGYSYPRFIIKNYSTNATVDTLDFPLTMENGLIEDSYEDFRRIELESGKYIDYGNKGTRLIFTLDYSSYARTAMMLDIQTLYNYFAQPTTYKILLIPRIDEQARYFEVRLHEQGAFSLGIRKGGANAISNRLPVLRFITTDLVNRNYIESGLNYLPLPLKSA